MSVFYSYIRFYACICKVVMYKCKINVLEGETIEYFRSVLLFRMESVASASVDEVRIEHDRGLSSIARDSKEATMEVFRCSYCPLEERFDFKGTKPPFARQLTYSEECYIMKDPFSLPNRGEVLVLGADCTFCEKPVCLGCSIYFGKRFCLNCASSNIQNLPSQLHSKINNLINSRN